MRYYQEVRMFDHHEADLRELFLCSVQIRLTCRKLCDWAHLTDEQYTTIDYDLYSVSTATMQDRIITLLRGILNRCCQRGIRHEIWRHIITSINDVEDDLRDKLSLALEELPIEPTVIVIPPSLRRQVNILHH